MRIHVTSTLLFFVALAAPAQGQLYLIAGSPNPKGSDTYASELLRVDVDGAVQAVAELVPKDVATELIKVSYDWRKALIDSYEEGSMLTVIDFDKAAVVKKCVFVYQPETLRSVA